MILDFKDVNNNYISAYFDGTIAPVPIPASISLLGSGLLALFASARKKIKAA